MKFKKILSLSLAALMSMSICASAKTLEFTMGSNTMYESADAINSYALENAPYTKNDRTMVPARIISERFGADVGWNPETSEVTIKKDDKTIVLTLGKQEALVNGEVVNLDVAPEEFNGRTMIPLRFVSEILGMDVDYVMSTSQVIISDEEPVMTINGVKITKDDYKSLLAYIGYNPEIDDAEFLIEEVNKLFKTLYSIYTFYAIDGYAHSDETAQQIKTELGSISEQIYKKALSAPAARLLEADIYVTQLVDNTLLSDSGIEVTQLIYEESYVTAKHILVSTEERTDAEAKKIADEVLKKVKNGDDFDTLIREYGEDPGALQNPDGYTFTYDEMVKEFEDAAFDLEIGKISGLVKSDFGYHIIKREPLAPIDEYNEYVVTEMAATRLYESMAKLSEENSEIIINWTDDEILELFK